MYDVEQLADFPFRICGDNICHWQEMGPKCSTFHCDIVIEIKTFLEPVKNSREKFVWRNKVCNNNTFNVPGCSSSCSDKSSRPRKQSSNTFIKLVTQDNEDYEEQEMSVWLELATEGNEETLRELSWVCHTLQSWAWMIVNLMLRPALSVW